MGLGLAFLTIGARLIPAAEVALITLLEVVLGPLWVWIALSERPSTATLAGGAVVMRRRRAAGGRRGGEPSESLARRRRAARLPVMTLRTSQTWAWWRSERGGSVR